MNMENKDLRHAKLMRVISHYATLKAAAEALGLEPGRLSQLKTGFRKVGDATARHIEEKLGLSRGWMDMSDTPVGTLAALGLDKALLQLIDIYAQLDIHQQHELVAHANSMLAKRMTTKTTAAPFAGVPKVKA